MFRKPSKCTEAQCPEVCNEGDFILFRDSDDPDTIVKIKRESWRMFLDAVKDGEFDLD